MALFPPSLAEAIVSNPGSPMPREMMSFLLSLSAYSLNVKAYSFLTLRLDSFSVLAPEDYISDVYLSDAEGSLMTSKA